MDAEIGWLLVQAMRNSFHDRRQQLLLRLDTTIEGIELFQARHYAGAPELRLASLVMELGSLRPKVDALSIMSDQSEALATLSDLETRYAGLEMALVAIYADVDPLLRGSSQ